MAGHKNDYSVQVFRYREKLITLKYVHNLFNLSKWLDNSKFKEWTYINVYDRRNGTFIKRYWKGSFIPPFI